MILEEIIKGITEKKKFHLCIEEGIEIHKTEKLEGEHYREREMRMEKAEKRKVRKSM